MGSRHSSIFDESFSECDGEASGEGKICTGGGEDAGGMKGRGWAVGEVTERVKRDPE